MPAAVAHEVRAKVEKDFPVVPDPAKQLVALAFKTIDDKHNELTFLRIYQGTLAPGMQLSLPARRLSFSNSRRALVSETDQPLPAW